ncbi:MAG: hypothetical protein D6725_16910 [Planctomycetota bacterium]|nr:MAG: hypothetical protein D6725_16910 [Planctomycetota bacterium]
MMAESIRRGAAFWSGTGRVRGIVAERPGTRTGGGHVRCASYPAGIASAIVVRSSTDTARGPVNDLPVARVVQADDTPCLRVIGRTSGKAGVIVPEP